MPFSNKTKVIQNLRGFSPQQDSVISKPDFSQILKNTDFTLNDEYNSESLNLLKEKNDKIVQQQLKVQQKLNELNIPLCVQNISPNFFKQYEQLMTYENSLEESLLKYRKLIKNTQDFSMISNTKKKIRIHIYNTFQNQKQNELEVNSMDPQHLLHSGPPSWSLKIQGTAKQTENDEENLRFSSFFSRILIINNNETILWDKQLEESSDIDGLEINRVGDQEHDVQLFFFFDYCTPTFSLSSELANFLGSERSTLPVILKTIWNHALTNCIPTPDTPVKFHTDPPLNAIFNGRDTFGLSDIPDFISHHLLPPKPILINHKLKLKGDWIQNCQTYDILIDSFDQDSMISSDSLSSSTIDNETSQKLLKKDQELVNYLEKLKSMAMKKNFFDSFSSNPIHFINSILTSRFMDSDKSLLSDHFLKDYKISDELSKYYKQPWLSSSIEKYLDKGRCSFEDEICNVVASMSIPDHKLTKIEEELPGNKRTRFNQDGNKSRVQIGRKKRFK